MEQIFVNPNIHFGKSCVTGTRIPVQSVLELVCEGLSFADIRCDYYPDLTADDIRACIGRVSNYPLPVRPARDICKDIA
jgi:uncharacterized protein (DUF433 family)